jgi:hypothetical protein
VMGRFQGARGKNGNGKVAVTLLGEWWWLAWQVIIVLIISEENFYNCQLSFKENSKAFK